MSIPSTSRDRVGILSSDAVFAAGAARALESSGFAVRRYTLWSELVASSPVKGILVLDADSMDAAAFRVAEAVEKSSDLIVVYASANDGETLRILRMHPFVSRIFSKSRQKPSTELAVLVRGLVAGRPWDVATCLMPGTPVRQELLHTYDERDGSAERLRHFASSLPAFGEFPALIAAAATEMVMNAFLDAPVKGLPARPVDMRYAADGERLAVSVADRFGLLTKAQVVDSLERCLRQGDDQIKMGPGGAGIGLYLMFVNACQLHFVVRPGTETCVVLVARVSKRHAEFSEGERVLTFTCGA